MGWSARCAVCMIPMERSRVHYGGVSCYSCRSFFRRITKARPTDYGCMRSGDCDITEYRRRNCIHCRYAQCLKVGMKPSAVLTEDMKKHRFWKKFEHFPLKPWKEKVPDGPTPQRLSISPDQSDQSCPATDRPVPMAFSPTPPPSLPSPPLAYPSPLSVSPSLLDSSTPLPVYPPKLLMYNSPLPVNNSPLPVYNSPLPVYNSPLPVYNSPLPVYNSPLPVYNSPLPGASPPLPYLAPPIASKLLSVAPPKHVAPIASHVPLNIKREPVTVLNLCLADHKSALLYVHKTGVKLMT